MSAPKEICPNCNKPIIASDSGGITLWLFACKCDLKSIQNLPKQEITICKTCNKRIPKKSSGSFTQFIFKYDQCKCELPLPSTELKESIEKRDFSSQPTFNFDVEEMEGELEIDAGLFPVERYKPVAQLGKGAGGAVYLCVDQILKKKVAVKTINSLTREELISFQEEAKVTSKLNHPNIVDILNFGVTDSGSPYMVLSYIKGITLEKFLQENGPLDWNTTVEIFIQICHALSYAHKHDIFHRDLTPGNFLIDFSDPENLKVSLIDFGVSLIKRNSQEVTSFQGRTIVGTPSYMSPDQAMGKQYNECSEIYSIGCVMYETLTGQPPFQGDTAMETISLHANSHPKKLNEVVNSEHPVLLQSLVDKCLAKATEHRYQNMSELISALEEISQIALSTHDQEAKTEWFIQEGKLDFVGDSTEYGRSILPFIMIILAGIFCTIFFVYELIFNSPDSNLKVSMSGKSMDLITNTADQYQLKIISPNGRRTIIVKDTITRAQLDNLASYKKISRVSFGNTEFDNGHLRRLARLAKNRNLSYTYLNLRYTRITDSGVARLRYFPELESLSLRGNRNITDESLPVIATLKYLIALDLKGTSITDDGIDNLLKLRDLQYLAISDCKGITDRSIPKILRMRNLQALHIGKSGISAEGAKSLIRSNKFKMLGLDGLHISEQIIPNMSDCRLTILTLRNNKFTDKLVKKIRPMKRLWYLDIINNEKMSQGAIDKITKIPNLRVVEYVPSLKNHIIFPEWFLEPQIYKNNIWDSRLLQEILRQSLDMYNTEFNLEPSSN